MIVGVVGRAQHGKDSTGNYLVENYGFKRYAFADQLKSMALALNPIVQTYAFPKHPERLSTLVSLLGWDKAKQLGEVRRFLQALGTEGVRDHLGEDSWVRALEKKLVDDGMEDPEKKTLVVVTDVRFPNEAEWVEKKGGQLWRVTRVEAYEAAGFGFRDYDNGVDPTHPSEAHVDELEVDHNIVAWDLPSLYKGIDQIMEDLKGVG